MAILKNKGTDKPVSSFQNGGNTATMGANQGTTPSYNQYYDDRGKFNQKQFFKDYPMPAPADWDESKRPWAKMLSNEQRAANFFSNNPYTFNTATGKWEAGTNSDQGTTHGGNSMDYTGNYDVTKTRVPMRYIINPYTGKEVGVPASKWNLDLGYTPRQKNGGLLNKAYKNGGLLYK